LWKGLLHDAVALKEVYRLSESKRVGMEKKEVQEIRSVLAAQQREMLLRVAKLPANSSEQRQGLQEFIDFNKYVQQFEDSLMQKYSVNVLESLEKEARTLRYLTMTLIGLTGVLAVLTALLASGIKI
jgi:hypothetical protein